MLRHTQDADDLADFVNPIVSSVAGLLLRCLNKPNRPLPNQRQTKSEEHDHANASGMLTNKVYTADRDMSTVHALP